ncbi:uncharacterized protein PADG_04291 [Paracoccidioides brasiliensis Pb18]|uniref:Extracellular membrane protein CFEM domain-containing protein n=1 Tax=Paracoccidioides brasiliensis (strain Pb18) TaxID=502780 RepID=C1GAK5_PARBD|nr:uncharacterized protein PADG_04291 [Paracoccidioides brasiliensis Pb18]EEH48207.2 hypothetical protein PADG_04291 [Paracoccidioides brasiliensis Pb18]ODH50496.1 hypothetical protein GX48_03314 [Paracoccidioides brasiliensis]
MKFNTGPVAAVLYVLFLVSSARDMRGQWNWSVCSLQTWCANDEDCRNQPDCVDKAFDHSKSLIFCSVSAVHPYTCWAWTGPDAANGKGKGENPK